MDDGELLRLLQQRLGGGGSSLTVVDVLAKYVVSPEFKALRDQKTELARIAHLIEHLGPLTASSLTLAVLDGYRTKRAAERGNRKVNGEWVRTSPSTRNREVDRMSRALNWAVERVLLSTNPIAEHPDEPEPPALQTCITTEDVDKMRAGAMIYPVPAITRLALRAMISTKFDGLLRRGEVCGLRWPMLDFRAGAIMLPQSETKAHRDTIRITVFSDRAIEDVRAMPRDVVSPFVFLTSRGTPWHPRTFLRYLQDVAARAGVKAAEGERVTAHSLRAGGATEQLEAGTPERVVMDLAGWTTRDMIDRYFRRRGAAAVARARARVARARREG